MLPDWGQQQPASALLDARPLGLSGQELKSFAWKLCYAIHDLHSELKCGGTHGALELANILVRYDAPVVTSLAIVNHHGSSPEHPAFGYTETPGASAQSSTLATTSTSPHAPIASPKKLSDASPCEELHGNLGRLITVTSGDGDGSVRDGFMRADGRSCVSNSACDTSGRGSMESCGAATCSTSVDNMTSGSGGACASRSSLRVVTGGCSPVCDNVEMTNGWCRAPEQLLQLPYDRPADMFALGCILAEVATGQPLFPSTSAAEQLRRMRRLLQPVGQCPAYSGGRISGCSTLSSDDYGTGSSDSNEKERPLRPWLLRGMARETQTSASSGGGGLIGALRTCAHSSTGVPSVAIADAAEEVERERERFVDLIEACLQINPGNRPTAEQVLKMTYFSSYSAVRLRSAPKPVALDGGNASAATEAPAASITAYVADIPDIIDSHDSGGVSPCTAVQAVPKHGASVPIVQLPVAEPPAVTPPESWPHSFSEFPLPSDMYDMVPDRQMRSSLEHCMKSSHPLYLRRVASAATSMAAPQQGAPSPSTTHPHDLWPQFLVTTQTTCSSPHSGCASFPWLSTGGECAAAAVAPTLSPTKPQVSAVVEQPINSLPMQYSQNPGQIGQPSLQALQKQEEAQVLDCPFHTPGSTTDLMQREVPAPAAETGAAAAKRWLGPTNLRPRAPRYGRKEPQGFESALDLSLMLLKGSANVAARYGRQPPTPPPPRPTSRRQDSERCSSQLSSRNNWVVGPGTGTGTGTGAGVRPSTQAEETGPDAAARADTDAETTGADADASGHQMVPLGGLCSEKATSAVLGTSGGSGGTGGGLAQAIAGASGSRQPYSRSGGVGSSLVSRNLIKRPSPLTLTADIEPIYVSAAAAACTAAAAAGSAYTCAPGGLFSLGGSDDSPSTEGPLQVSNPPPQVSRPGGGRLRSHSSDVTVPHLDLTCIRQGARRQGVEIAADCAAAVCSVSALQEGSCSYADCSGNSARSGRSTADQSGVLLTVAASPSQPQATQRHPSNLESVTDPKAAAMTGYTWATAPADPGVISSTDCRTAPLYGAIRVGRLIDGASKRRTRRSCSESQLSVHPSDPRFNCISPASYAAATAAADTAATATCVGWSGCPVKGAASSSPRSGCGGLNVNAFIVGNPAAQKLATETRLLWPGDLGPPPSRNMHHRMPKLSVDGGGGGGGSSDGGRWPLPRLLNVLQRELIAQQHQYSTTTMFGSSSSTVGGGFAARSLPLYESDHLHTLSEASESSSSEIRLPVIHSIILPPNAGGEEEAVSPNTQAKADPSKRLLQPPPSPAETRRVTTGRLDMHSGMMLKTRLFDMGDGMAATATATAAYGSLPSPTAAAPLEAATSKGLVQRARERFRIVFSEDGSGRAARDGGRSGGDGSIGGGDGSRRGGDGSGGGGDGSRRGDDGSRGGGDGGRNGGDGCRRGGNGSRGGGDESRGGIDGGRSGGDGYRVSAEVYKARPPRGSLSGTDSSAMTGGSSGGKMALMSTLSRALRLGASIRQRVMPEKKEAR